MKSNPISALAAIATLALATGAPSVQAENPITFNFTGVITSVDDALGWFQDTYEVGATVTGSYTFFDSSYLTAVDFLDPDHSVFYQYYFKPNFPGVPLTNPDFRLKAGDREIRKDSSPFAWDSFVIRTWNDSAQSFPGAGDGYGATSAIGFPSFWRDFSGDPILDPDDFFVPLPIANLRLHDPTGNALNSVALPLMPPDLAAFSERIGSITISDGNGEADYATAQFRITSFFAPGSSGTLLTTFINPSLPGNNFGNSVAAVGSDRIILGANSDNTGAEFAGAAYLFDTSGMLLTTFTNPTPADYYEVTAMGSDRVIIATPQQTYLFSTNGSLLTAITPSFQGIAAVAAVGSDRVIITSMIDGVAALFALYDPSLSISTSNGLMTISWPIFPGFELQQNTNLSTANWTAPLEAVTDDGTNYFIQVNPPTGNRFYRLLKP
jgi:hypothetical protein